MTVGLPGAGILGTSGVVKLTSKDGSLSVTPTRGTGFVDLSVAGAGSAFWQESLPDYLNPTPDGCGNNKSVRTWNYECSPNNQSFFSMYDCTRCHDICMGLPSTFNCEVDRMAFYNSSGAQIESDVNWWSRCDGSCLNGGDVLTWDASYNAWVGAPDCDNGYTGCDSVVVCGCYIYLCNDTSQLGYPCYYGTCCDATLGWYSLPCGGGCGVISLCGLQNCISLYGQGDICVYNCGNDIYICGNGGCGYSYYGIDSITINCCNQISLVNDICGVGYDCYYGTCNGWTLGWYQLPSGGFGGCGVVSLCGLQNCINLYSNSGLCIYTCSNDIYIDDYDCGGGFSTNYPLYFCCTTLSLGYAAPLYLDCSCNLNVAYDGYSIVLNGSNQLETCGCCTTVSWYDQSGGYHQLDFSYGLLTNGY